MVAVRLLSKRHTHTQSCKTANTGSGKASFTFNTSGASVACMYHKSRRPFVLPGQRILVLSLQDIHLVALMLE